MIKFDYKFLKIYKKIRQKGEENETNNILSGLVISLNIVGVVCLIY